MPSRIQKPLESQLITLPFISATLFTQYYLSVLLNNKIIRKNGLEIRLVDRKWVYVKNAARK